MKHKRPVLAIIAILATAFIANKMDGDNHPVFADPYYPEAIPASTTEPFSPPTIARIEPVVRAVSVPKDTVPPTTTTTTTAPAAVPVFEQEVATPDVPYYKGRTESNCHQFLDLAREVGWGEAELPKLSYIMWRESRCDPWAWNQDDPTPDGSRGLTQINGFWCRPSKYNPDGYLQTVQPELLALSGTCADLHDPAINLRAAKAIYDYGVGRNQNPWGPWAL